MMADPLNRDELRLLMAIIDMAAQRGLFKGEELSSVGHLFSRLGELGSQPEAPAE